MYFEIAKKDLLTPLKMITSVVEQRQTLPILANTLVIVKNNSLSLTATDAEVEISCNLPLTNGDLIADNYGETTIHARKFFDICKSLPDVSIQVTVEDNQAILNAGKSKFKLQTLSADEFPSSPSLKDAKEFLIAPQDLKHLIYKTSFCIATNDVRYYLTGLLLEIANKKISFVATDGHRMAVAQIDLDDDDLVHKVIIPRKAVVELSKLLKDGESDVKILMDDNHISFELNDNVVMTSKLIDGNFPEWQNVLPSNNDKIVIADTKLLKDALSRASILSNEKFKGIRLNLSENLITLSAKNTYQEEAEEVVEVEYSGEELEIGFNGGYLLDALNVISTNMTQLAFGDNNSSCLITEEDNDDCKFIVMPMRL